MPGSVTLVGLTANANATPELSLALDIDNQNLLDVPVALIERIETLGTVTVGTRDFQRVRIHLKPATTPEGRLLAQVAASTEAALHSIVNKLVPLIPAPTIRDACHDCINACTLVPVPPDDPFAQITCMLSCSACPG